MLRLGLFVTALCLLCFSGPNVGSASEKQGANGEAQQAPACHKKISIKGRPHRISSVASLSAVRMWSQTAMKHGDSYSMWHNAKAAKVSCEKLPRSDYFACYAEGKPCRNSNTQASATNN